MSSGDKAKPPATEERNPFDISRRSGNDVAAEIAKRMAAWKKARDRNPARPTSAPSGEAKPLPSAAPVQSAPAPKPAGPEPAPRSEQRAARDAARVPYFAQSAVRRAMPPAPSLKQGSARPQASSGLDETPLAAPDVQSCATPETPLADPHPTAVASTEANVREIVAPSQAFDAIVDRTPGPMPVESDDDKRRRAEARAIKARWMAAHDPDALIDTSGAVSDVASAEHDAAVEAVAGEQPVPESASEFVAEPRAAAGEAPYKATESPGPARDERMARVTPALRAGHDVAWETPALGLAALDEMAGRDEPTFDAPHKAPEDDAAEVPPAEKPAPKPDAIAHRDEKISIAALDEIASRKEPTFDAPVQRALAHRHEPETVKPAPADHNAANRAREREMHMGSDPDELISRVTSTTSADRHAVNEESQLSIAALDEAAGRREPTFDEPVQAIKPAAANAAAPHIALRPIETRIEARRIDALRADPQLAVRGPILPHAEPEEWPVPPPIAAQAQGERRGAGWAIGLGSLLLIAGITAPAAIWQQGGQALLDQVALGTPEPTTTPSPPTTSVTTAEGPAQATVPAAPQPEPPPATPAADTPESAATSNPTTSPQEQKAEHTASNEQPATLAAANPHAGHPPSNTRPVTTLGAVSDGGDVNEAPVVAPPPMVNLASKPAAGPSPMVARPFVPEQGDGPFLRAPTTGAASISVGSSQPGAQPFETGTKPRLMGQLKPKATGMASASKPVAGKPRATARTPKPFFQQSPDQMFETLIETLSEGRPVNPATKPAAPSNRR